ncbi:MAG: hypothetical protein OEX76_07755 [Candidatus Bathyarchaeota archaeon]|nr:hypothetical protein [Candidatus Bathyarchaeota archaeon]MDH5531924.1 hypothetical protein [Candidatus Bathyarchaeota archaeon]MDH5712467.1 hypothetical protein [Candidatus Bathyarchaeota archaeon]
MSVGAVGGFLVGYAIKKVMKILIIILGFCSVAVSYLGFSGIINVNFEKLTTATSGLITQASGVLSTIVGGLPFASTFSAGLAIGIIKG